MDPEPPVDPGPLPLVEASPADSSSYRSVVLSAQVVSLLERTDRLFSRQP